MLVGFPYIDDEAFENKDNRPAILRWMDFVETPLQAIVGCRPRFARRVLPRVDEPVYDCELRVPPISGTVTSYTPIGG